MDVPIDVPDEVEEISAAVKGPNNEYVQSRLQREADGLYHVRFLPSKAGKYVVDVRCAGEPVENSPFVMKIAEPENVQVKLKQFEQQVGEIVGQNVSVRDKHVALLPTAV